MTGLPTCTIHIGEALDILRSLPSESIQTCVTSPPYWGLRDYGNDGQLGHEPTPMEFVRRLVGIFDEVRRVLKKDGTMWLNIGDSYFSRQNSNRNGLGGSTIGGEARGGGEYKTQRSSAGELALKVKDLCGIPWRVAFALQDAGWYLRQDIVWAKPNPMPESVRDRCVKSHEYLFLLSKSEKYHFDHEAIKERSTNTKAAGNKTHKYTAQYEAEKAITQQHRTKAGLLALSGKVWEKRAKRSVWNIPVARYSGAHFAVFPTRLVEPCVLAGSRPGDTVLDPFIGSGTTGLVAVSHGRHCVGIELNGDYTDLQRERIPPLCLDIKDAVNAYEISA